MWLAMSRIRLWLFEVTLMLLAVLNWVVSAVTILLVLVRGRFIMGTLKVLSRLTTILIRGSRALGALLVLEVVLVIWRAPQSGSRLMCYRGC